MPGVPGHFHILPSAPTGGKQETEVLGERRISPRKTTVEAKEAQPRLPALEARSRDWRERSSNPGAPGLREPIKTTLLLKSGEGFYLTMATDSLLKGKLRSPLCFLLAQCLMAEG